MDSTSRRNNTTYPQSTTNKSFQKKADNSQSLFETKVLSMIANLQKSFENLSTELFEIKVELYKYNSHISSLESIIIGNFDNNQTYQDHEHIKDYENHTMKNVEENHDSNATKNPSQNKDTSKQYYSILTTSHPDIKDPEPQSLSFQKLILDQLSQLTNQFKQLQNKNAQLKQQMSTTSLLPFIPSLNLFPSYD